MSDERQRRNDATRVVGQCDRQCVIMAGCQVCLPDGQRRPEVTPTGVREADHMRAEDFVRRYFGITSVDAVAVSILADHFELVRRSERERIDELRQRTGEARHAFRGVFTCEHCGKERSAEEHQSAPDSDAQWRGGAEAERKLILAWLRWEADHRPSPTDQRLRDAASAIETDEHYDLALKQRRERVTPSLLDQINEQREMIGNPPMTEGELRAVADNASKARVEQLETALRSCLTLCEDCGTFATWKAYAPSTHGFRPSYCDSCKVKRESDMDTGRRAQCLRFSDWKRLTRNIELTGIYAASAVAESDRPSYAKGDRVRVDGGAWESSRGKLATVDHVYRPADDGSQVIRIVVDGEPGTLSLAAFDVSPAPSSDSSSDDPKVKP